jgi:signal transduction histidine kinase
MADKKDVKIKFSKKWNKQLFINKQYFYILFSNILKNAIRYNKKWGSVIITLDANKIKIKDTWIWIKKDDLNNIFDRFFMSTSSRNNEWNGIWLSLVKKIADIYSIKIYVKSEEWKWSEFSIEL